MIRELITRLSSDATSIGISVLLIGGHAVTRLGHPRMTLDIDLLVRKREVQSWDRILHGYGYQCYSKADAFAQFSGRPGWPRIDLMLVDDTTFDKLAADSVLEGGIATPSARHMVALKLHATRSPTRDKAEIDWDDIAHLVRLHRLDPGESGFRQTILQHGGETALARIQKVWDAHHDE